VCDGLCVLITDESRCYLECIRMRVWICRLDCPLQFYAIRIFNCLELPLAFF